MIDVAIAIDAEAVPVMLERQAPDSYSETGDLIEATASSHSIMAAIQPATSRDYQSLPEGMQGSVMLTGYSRFAVRLDDRVTYLGERFKVLHLWPRPQDGFTKFAMGRL